MAAVTVCQNRSARRNVTGIVVSGLYATAVAAAVMWTLFPFYWAAITSIKDGFSIFGNHWLPFVSFEPTLDSWRTLADKPHLVRSFLNSVAIAVPAATIALLLGTPAAYAVARVPFPSGWAAGFATWFILQRVAPPVVFVTPYILISRQVGLDDSVLSTMLVNATLNLPLVAIILSGAFREVPRSLEESAWIDGASRWRSFRGVALPLVAPGLAASWLLAFAFSWNEAMFASALSFDASRSMPVLMQSNGGLGGANLGGATTQVILGMSLPLLAALFAQRHIVRGLSLGGVKG
ncbi:MAG: carbohydrate ABC transporter permease [Thermomicrobiales bacterium]